MGLYNIARRPAKTAPKLAPVIPSCAAAPVSAAGGWSSLAASDAPSPEDSSSLAALDASSTGQSTVSGSVTPCGSHKLRANVSSARACVVSGSYDILREVMNREQRGARELSLCVGCVTCNEI